MAESELSKAEHVSVADSEEREDRSVWVDERLSEIEYQSYRATTFCIVGIGSVGVVLPFLDANVEFGIELFVRPALILTGVLMLLLSISLLKKDMKTQVSKTMLRSQDWYSHLCFLHSHMSIAG
ncbi:MAG: hypothetical protein L7S59_06175 [Pseudomonadales bacterium]|nr:hypothetical protein [Pseudomonadales bacterium]